MSVNKILKNIFGEKDTESAPMETETPKTCGTNLTDHKEEDDVELNPQEEDAVEHHLHEGSSSAVYNLIILDESGSMSGVTEQTISGCNETLNGIRSTAKEDKEQRQYVSIYCFDDTNSRYIFKNVPIEETRHLTSRDYHPNACTPLYDAIGFTVSQLRELATDSNSIGKVTIITDGLENASKRWNHSSVVELIESLKKKGWLFTFIGANIDVENTATSLGIHSYMEFKQTDEGMRDMFECERRSQRAYSRKMSFMRRSQCFNEASEEERERMFSSMNENYFTEGERISPSRVRTLSPDEIFVFGSNVKGLHSGSAAELAVRQFGAIMGQSEGLQGQSYAIPTVGNSFAELERAIERFTEYAALHPRNRFILTAIGCGNAGYAPEQIAPLFKNAYEFGNVYIPSSFLPYIQ